MSPSDLYIPRIGRLQDRPPDDFLSHSTTCIPTEMLDVCTTWKGLSPCDAFELFVWERTFRSHFERVLRPELEYLQSSSRHREPNPDDRRIRVQIDLVTLVRDIVKQFQSRNPDLELFSSSSNIYLLVEEFVRTHDCFLDPQHRNYDNNTSHDPSVFLTLPCPQQPGSQTWAETPVEVWWQPPRLSFENFDIHLSPGDFVSFSPRLEVSTMNPRSLDIRYFSSSDWMHYDASCNCFNGILPTDVPSQPISAIITAMVTQSFGDKVLFERSIRARVTFLVHGVVPGSAPNQDYCAFYANVPKPKLPNVTLDRQHRTFCKRMPTFKRKSVQSSDFGALVQEAADHRNDEGRNTPSSYVRLRRQNDSRDGSNALQGSVRDSTGALDYIDPLLFSSQLHSHTQLPPDPTWCDKTHSASYPIPASTKETSNVAEGRLAPPQVSPSNRDSLPAHVLKQPTETLKREKIATGRVTRTRNKAHRRGRRRRVRIFSRDGSFPSQLPLPGPKPDDNGDEREPAALTSRLAKRRLESSGSGNDGAHKEDPFDAEGDGCGRSILTDPLPPQVQADSSLNRFASLRVSDESIHAEADGDDDDDINNSSTVVDEAGRETWTTWPLTASPKSTEKVFPLSPTSQETQSRTVGLERKAHGRRPTDRDGAKPTHHSDATPNDPYERFLRSQGLFEWKETLPIRSRAANCSATEKRQVKNDSPVDNGVEIGSIATCGEKTEELPESSMLRADSLASEGQNKGGNMVNDAEDAIDKAAVNSEASGNHSLSALPEDFRSTAASPRDQDDRKDEMLDNECGGWSLKVNAEAEARSWFKRFQQRDCTSKVEGSELGHANIAAAWDQERARGGSVDDSTGSTPTYESTELFLYRPSKEKKGQITAPDSLDHKLGLAHEFCRTADADTDMPSPLCCEPDLCFYTFDGASPSCERVFSWTVPPAKIGEIAEKSRRAASRPVSPKGTRTSIFGPPPEVSASEPRNYGQQQQQQQLSLPPSPTAARAKPCDLEVRALEEALADQEVRAKRVKDEIEMHIKELRKSRLKDRLEDACEERSRSLRRGLWGSSWDAEEVLGWESRSEVGSGSESESEGEGEGGSKGCEMEGRDG